MRANTKKKQKMGKRFAIVICVAATGVMALGAQTGTAASEDVVEFNTRLTIHEAARYYNMSGHVYSDGGWHCEVGRRVTLFKQKPGADRRIVVVRSAPALDGAFAGTWGSGIPQGSLPVKAGWRVYAKATRKVRDGFMCRGDRSPIEVVGLRK